MQSAIATVHRYAGNGRQLDDPTLGRQRTKRRRAAIAATTAEAIAEMLVDLGPDPFEQWADVEWRHLGARPAHPGPARRRPAEVQPGRPAPPLRHPRRRHHQRTLRNLCDTPPTTTA